MIARLDRPPPRPDNRAYATFERAGRRGSSGNAMLDRVDDEAPRLSPADEVRRLTLGRIRHFLQSPDGGSVYGDLKGLCSTVSVSYRDRAVLELLQNAHDAHAPESRDGRILFLYAADEGEHGVLYAANDGSGFSAPNFTALCSPTRTTKSVNEAIGNKGVGFLSVFQICAHPEIFSRAAPIGSPDFDGYCFSFGDRNRVEAFLAAEGLAAVSDSVLDQMPQLYLAVPTEIGCETVRRLGRTGYATVLRLPIKNSEAASAVRAQLTGLVAGKPDVQLFLDRIGELEVEIDGVSHRLTRAGRDLTREDDFSLEQVTCGSTAYILARRRIAETVIKAAIESDILAEALPESWRSWTGDAVVSVAVAASGEPLTGRLYNFLPMDEEARSPLNGHLDAPFFATIERKRLEAGVGFNDKLLAYARDLALRTAAAARTCLDDELARPVVADLLFWDGAGGDQIRAALLSSRERLIPAEKRRGKPQWASLDEVRLWEGDAFFDPPRVARIASFPLADSRLGPARLTRLRRFAAADGLLAITNEEKADVAVAAAQDLHAAARPMADWNRLYAALPALLPGQGQRLQGRPILLTERNDLAAALEPVGRGRGRRRLSSVFLPPLRTAGSVATLPVVVQRRITFLHRDLVVGLEGADEGRRYLIASGLVREYDRREVLRVMASVITDPGQARDPESVRWEVLAAIQSMCASVDGSPGEVAELPLLVPTRSGWTRATDAFFGDWPGTDSSDLDDLFLATAPVSHELAELSQRRLLPYADWSVGSGDRDAWIGFLKSAGVSSHLRPRPALTGTAPRVQGSMLAWTLSNRDVLIAPTHHAAWRGRLQAQATPPNPNTTYTVRNVARLPGQADYDAIASVAAEAFALQIIRMLEAEPGLVTMEIHRPFHPAYPNTRSWPSPAGAFLSEIPWLPATGDRLLTVREAWLPAVDEAAPAQAPLVAPRVRRLIDRLDRARSALRDLGLSSFGDADQAWALIEQAGQWIRTSGQPAERLLALTQEAWRQADLSRPCPEELRLLVRIAGEVTAIEPRTDGRLIYVADTDDRSAAASILRATPGAVVFEPPISRALDVGAYLRQHLGDRVQRMSDMEVVYVTPSGDFAFDASDPPLEQAVTTDLRGFVAMAVRYRCPFSNIGPETALGRLRALRIRWLDDLRLRIGDHIQPVSAFQQSAVLARAPQGDTLLAPAAARGSDGELLVLAAALGEALGSRRTLGEPMIGFAAQLQQIGEGVTPAALASTLGLSVQDVSALLKDARAILSDLCRVARPFLILWGDERLAETVLDPSRLAGESDLVAAIAQCGLGIAGDAASFVEVCRSGSVEAVALQFDVDLAALNTILEELGPPYVVVDRSAHHSDGFAAYYLRRQGEVREAVRRAYRPGFLRGDLETYVAMRDRPAPEPPPGIGLTKLRSDAVTWQKWLDDWLMEAGAAADDLRDDGDLDVVRDRNRRAVRALVPTARAIALARGGSEEALDFWRDPDTLLDRATAAAVRSGWLDFDLLDTPLILQWFARTGQWPGDWPCSLDPQEHGLTEAALNDWSLRDRRQRAAAARPPRTLSFTGGEYIVGETRLSDLAEQIAALAESNTALLASSMRTVKGGPVSLPRRNSGGGDRKPSKGSGADRMTDEEKSVIGYFGEAIAFAWLKARFGGKRVIDETCWKSEYRRHVCGQPGDDSLGYDFEVRSGRVTWFFEVKATASPDPGDLRMVELGSTEIARAELCRSENRQHYRILHVVNALQPDRAVLRVLPNPRSSEGKAFYTEQNSSGVRLYFPVPS